MDAVIQQPMPEHVNSSDDVLNERTADSEFVARVPISFARRFCVLGLASDNRVLPVAISEDTDPDVLTKLAVLLGRPAQADPAPRAAIQRAINRAYGARSSVVDSVIAGMNADVEVLDGSGASADLLDDTGASSVTQFVNNVLLDAVKRRASDVHVQPFEDRLQVRLRIDGVLYDYVQPPLHLLNEIVSRIKVMGRMNIAERRVAQDGRTTVRVGEKIIDLRISILPTSFGERVVLRLLDKSARLYRLQELGMSDRDQRVFRELVTRTHGMILVTGPTGSGKSTTLYAALQELDCTQLNVLTLEDPIEYQLPGISQTQVSAKKGMTFATGLRTVLRQDPDVIMVGEIRDEETARMAIQSSLTGHLVLSTLHTNDASGAVARLLDLGIEPYLVAGSLLASLAQRLVRRVCDGCRVRGTMTIDQADLLGLEPSPNDVTLYSAAGCDACFGTGYRDRVGIFEQLVVTEQIAHLITARSDSRDIKRTAMDEGMTTLRQDAVRLLLSGRTTIEELLRVTHA